MLHLLAGYDEWQIAEAARRYISLYAKPGDTVCYVPYVDDLRREQKAVKFVYINDQWIYADNSHES